jgi:hypothetical protein
MLYSVLKTYSRTFQYSHCCVALGAPYDLCCKKINEQGYWILICSVNIRRELRYRTQRSQYSTLINGIFKSVLPLKGVFHLP